MSIADLDRETENSNSWDALRYITWLCFRTAEEHGWWDDKDSGRPLTTEERRSDAKFMEKVALMHSELSEALEEVRAGREYLYVEDGKPEGVIVELADCVIRIMDYVGGLDSIDLFVESMRTKMAYNETRPYRHGGKRA